MSLPEADRWPCTRALLRFLLQPERRYVQMRYDFATRAQELLLQGWPTEARAIAPRTEWRDLVDTWPGVSQLEAPF